MTIVHGVQAGGDGMPSEMKDEHVMLFEPDRALEGQTWKRFVERYLARLHEQPWFDAARPDWWQGVAQRTLKRLILQQRSHPKASAAPNDMEQWLKENVQAVFFDPKVVEMIYSPHEPSQNLLVNYGANLHCRWMESVVKNIVYRHSGSVQQLSIQPDTLIDELWGMVMEETVMCLTDLSVHLWKADGTHREFPPLGTRGRRKGGFLRAALSPNRNQIAGYRIDHQLMVWDAETQECTAQLDMSAASEEGQAKEAPLILIFSEDGKRIALEYPNQRIAVISLSQKNDPIEWYSSGHRNKFEKTFGKITIPVREKNKVQDEARIENVYDWVSDAEGQVIVTASRSTRTMPEWMLKAGFDRSIRHIAKKRLIDLIRKHSHTAYACWQCGSMRSSFSDTQCRNCGVDFTRCPVGCSETLSAETHWECPSCGYATRLYQAYQEVDPESIERMAESSSQNVQDEMDYRKLMDTMSMVYLTYKSRSIPCAELIRYKSEGLTNETIGNELNVPRGSVDYLWNQCKSLIQMQMGFAT